MFLTAVIKSLAIPFSNSTGRAAIRCELRKLRPIKTSGGFIITINRTQKTGLTFRMSCRQMAKDCEQSRIWFDVFTLALPISSRIILSFNWNYTITSRNICSYWVESVNSRRSLKKYWFINGGNMTRRRYAGNYIMELGEIMNALESKKESIVQLIYLEHRYLKVAYYSVSNWRAPLTCWSWVPIWINWMLPLLYTKVYIHCFYTRRKVCITIHWTALYMKGYRRMTEVVY